MVKWNGWGYKDSRFFLNPTGQAEFYGKRSDVCVHSQSSFVVLKVNNVPLCRYEIGGQEMPLMRGWMEKTFGFDISLTSFSQV